jgi:hypothetical protein
MLLANEGESSLVFVTRNGTSFYREQQVFAEVEVGGKTVRKLVGVKIHKPILCTFGRMVRELKLEGVTFYRLRHSFATLGTASRDREAIDLMWGIQMRAVARLEFIITRPLSGGGFDGLIAVRSRGSIR